MTEFADSNEVIARADAHIAKRLKQQAFEVMMATEDPRVVATEKEAESVGYSLEEGQYVDIPKQTIDNNQNA